MPAYSGMSCTSTPRPTIAAWWQTASTPRSERSTVAWSRKSPITRSTSSVPGGRAPVRGGAGGRRGGEHADLVTRGAAGGGHGRPDEAGAAGDQHVHGAER